MSVISSPPESRSLTTAPPEVLARIMSPAQSHRLAELRAEHPDLTYAPTYVHGISGMLEISVRRGERELRVVGITGSGGDVAFTIVTRYNSRKSA